eukprot:NODE_1200_length_1053_cov_117.370518_g931_i0.p2 GENE.NODE_1200_length_1053_cov_117.370518_g931_i0~~NODE_1200_length_1053_cov_117.370518_g931_i0.p2  ORF type:complete len:61 (-),score=1.68 NODE_1200_length_1053_cov_117.370518_g931_i0:676-858(-)
MILGGGGVHESVCNMHMFCAYAICASCGLVMMVCKHDDGMLHHMHAHRTFFNVGGCGCTS